MTRRPRIGRVRSSGRPGASERRPARSLYRRAGSMVAAGRRAGQRPRPRPASAWPNPDLIRGTSRTPVVWSTWGFGDRAWNAEGGTMGTTGLVGVMALVGLVGSDGLTKPTVDFRLQDHRGSWHT